MQRNSYLGPPECRGPRKRALAIYPSLLQMKILKSVRIAAKRSISIHANSSQLPDFRPLFGSYPETAFARSPFKVVIYPE